MQISKGQIQRDNHLALLEGLKGLIFKDIQPDRIDLFKKYLHCNPLASFAYFIINSHVFLKAIGVIPYFFLNYLFLTINKKAPIATMIKHQNEKRTFEKYVINKKDTALISKNLLGIVDGSTICLNLSKLFKLIRFFNRLLKKYDLYVVLRAAELTAYYSRLYAFFKRNRLKGVLIFTDNNPNGLALMSAAQRFHIPCYFISHAEPLPPIYPLRCKGAFLLGEKSLRKYEKAGSQFEKVYFIGHKDVYRKFIPIDVTKKLTVGVFLGKLSSLTHLKGLLLSLQAALNIKNILIRPHPNTSFNDLRNLRASVPNGVTLLASTSLKADMKECDLILAGNSASQLDALLMGKATLFCKEIEEQHQDMYGYVQDGLVLCWSNTLTLHQINEFYSSCSMEKASEYCDLSQTFQESIKQFDQYIFN